MIQREDINKLIEVELAGLAKKFKFNSLEQVRKHFKLVDREFEVGVVLTPTMKIMRDKAKKQFSQQIAELYAES